MRPAIATLLLILCCSAAAYGQEAVSRAAESDRSRFVVIHAIEPSSGETHSWYCRLAYTQSALNEVRIVEFDQDARGLTRSGYAQFIPLGSRLKFIDHHDKIVITYDLGSAEAVASLMAWRIPKQLLSDHEDLADAQEPAAAERREGAILGSFRRADQRIAVVRELTNERLEDGGARVEDRFIRPQTAARR